MPSNRAYNDVDIVQTTQYMVPPNWITEKPPPESWELPKFKPFLIDDYHHLISEH